MNWDLAGTILARLLFAVPMLYIGQLMATDPASLIRSLEVLAWALRTFEQRLRGVQRQEQPPGPFLFHVSPLARQLIRLTGVAVSVCAVLPLVDLAAR